MNDPVIVDTDAAALYAEVRPVTIRQWIRRGKISAKGRDGRRTLVDLRDIDRILPRGEAA